MLPNWTNHLKDPKAKKAFADYISGSKGLIDRLSDMIKEKEMSVENLELDFKAYDNPSWDVRQADINGQRRTLRWIQTLLTLDPKDKPNG